MAIENKIRNIGVQMVQCEMNCDDVFHCAEKGILPRCLYVEEPSKKLDCVVVGLNPGKFNDSSDEPKEIKKYNSNPEKLYEESVKYWGTNYKKGNSKVKYWEKTRNCLKKLGIYDNNSILWTELCKCENGKKGVNPGFNTLRRCSQKWLKQELENLEGVPIIALHNDVYTALSFLYPDRCVIGIPHPTGSKGQFDEVYKHSEKLVKDVKKAIKEKTSVKLTTLLKAQSEL